mgnify:CR=1 FL=1
MDRVGQDLRVEGEIVSLPEVYPRRTRFELQPSAVWHDGQRVAFRGRLRLSWYSGRASTLRAGDRWMMVVRLKRPRGMRNPGGFDYEGWLFRHGIRATGYVRRDRRNRRLGAGGDLLDRLRQQLRTGIGDALPDARHRGLLTALAIGDRHGVDVHAWSVLRRTGTAHLMAISGLHIGLVSTLGFLLFRWLWSRSARALERVPAPKIGAIGAVMTAAAYAALAGFSLPTERALVMVGAAALAVLMQRRLRPSHTLAVAAFAVLVLDPLSVSSWGFWLSFVAVAVILYGTSGRLGEGRLWWRWGRVQWLITLGMLPLGLLFFGQMSLVAPLANLVAVPWVGFVVVPLDLLGAVLTPAMPGMGRAVLHGAAAALGALWYLLERLSAPSFAAWHLPPPAGWTLIPATIGLIWLLAPRGWPARWVGSFGLLPLLLLHPVKPPPGQAWLTLLDVGQGLSVVLRTARHTLVYDTGPRYSATFDTGRAVVVPFLRAKGVESVDTLVLSHGQNDHVGGARSVLAALPVRRILAGDPSDPSGAERCRVGQHWRWDGVAFRIMHPVEVEGGNNGSCVLRVTTAAGSALLTGDIEAPAEAALVRRYPRLHADVLVAPHHGSRTSSTPAFVSAVAPEYTLFSTGYRNRYGFPDPIVVGRYRRAGASVFDTSRQGALTIRLGSPNAEIEAYRPSARHYWNAAAVP